MLFVSLFVSPASARLHLSRCPDTSPSLPSKSSFGWSYLSGDRIGTIDVITELNTNERTITIPANVPKHTQKKRTALFFLMYCENVTK